MASIKQTKSGWRASIFMKGQRPTKTFPTKAQAQAWATKTEADIIAGNLDTTPDKTFGELLTHYAETVSVKKKGVRWEVVRINKFLRDPIAQVKLSEINSSHFAEWRDRRLKEVQAGSVLREWNILSNSCKVARDEWKWMTENPMKPVAKPKKPPPRKRIATSEENQAMMLCAGYNKTATLTTVTLRTIAAYLFANETALRAGEICALEWSEIYIEDGYLKVIGIKPGARKNNAAVRDVPLSPRAVEILNQLKLTMEDGNTAFNILPNSLDPLFRKVRDRAAVEELTFHDSRHAGITMLARHYDVLDLARIVGHTNVRELMTYYNPTIADMVKRAKW